MHSLSQDKMHKQDAQGAPSRTQCSVRLHTGETELSVKKDKNFCGEPCNGKPHEMDPAWELRDPEENK